MRVFWLYYVSLKKFKVMYEGFPTIRYRTYPEQIEFISAPRTQRLPDIFISTPHTPLMSPKLPLSFRFSDLINTLYTFLMS